MRSVKVIDASAMGAVMFGEPAASEVVDRIGGSAVMAPTLLPYEITSIGLKKIRRHPRQRDRILQALATYPRLDIEEVEVPVLESMLLAEKTTLTAYDAAYLWLSESLGIELVSLDEDLMRAAMRDI